MIAVIDTLLTAHIQYSMHQNFINFQTTIISHNTLPMSKEIVPILVTNVLLLFN